jgi:hypothetical protein
MSRRGEGMLVGLLVGGRNQGDERGAAASSLSPLPPSPPLGGCWVRGQVGVSSVAREAGH